MTFRRPFPERAIPFRPSSRSSSWWRQGPHPGEAIKVATCNGAEYLGQPGRIGTLEAGKQGDMILIRGDPYRNIADIRLVETVFKEGLGYDSARLLQQVKGTVGTR
jgi:adenine deaminase